MKLVTTELLEALAAEALHGDSKQQARYDGNGHAFDVESFIRRHGLDVTGPESWNGKQGSGQRWVFRKSPMCEHHDGAAFILQHATGAVTAGCHHNSCSWSWRDLRAKLEPKGERDKTQPAPAPPIPRYSPFPLDALAKPLAQFVAAGAKAIGCDATFIALPLLSAVAGAIGNTRSIRLKGSWYEPSILWTAPVAESGRLKSPAQRQVLRPVLDVQRRLLAEHAEAMKEYEREKLEFEKKLSEWKKSKNAGDPPLDEKPEEPKPQRVMVSDTTVEAIAPILKDNPRGVVLFRDELSAWLGSHDAYKAKGVRVDTPQWLSMHSGEPIVVDRKTGTPRTIFVPHAYVSVTGGIQPATLRRALSQEHLEDGLGPRILFAMPEDKKKRWTDADLAEHHTDAIAELLARLYQLEPVCLDDDETCPMALPLSPEAKVLWVSFYNDHAAEIFEAEGPIASALAKIEGAAARLALLHHVVTSVASGTDATEPVTAASMEAGITLAKWFAGEARRVYATFAESEDAREQRRLVEWIARQGREVSPREVCQRIWSVRSVDEAEEQLSKLVKAGLGSWAVLPSTGGAQKRVFRLASDESTSTEAQKHRENESCVDVDAHGESGNEWREI